MNSFLLFVLLSSIAVVIHSKDSKNRAAGCPSSLRNYPDTVKNEFMDIINNISDEEKRFAKLREFGVKHGKEMEKIVEDLIEKVTKRKNEKPSKTKEEKKKNESKKDTKKETKEDPKKDSKKA